MLSIQILNHLVQQGLYSLVQAPQDLVDQGSRAICSFIVQVLDYLGLARRP